MLLLYLLKSCLVVFINYFIWSGEKVGDTRREHVQYYTVLLLVVVQGVSTRLLFSRSMWLCQAERIGFTIFSENDNSSLKCVTKGGYKLKDIYVDNILHYFSIDVNMHENHELTRPRLTLLELLYMLNPGHHTANGQREGKRESVTRGREVSQEVVTLQVVILLLLASATNKTMSRCSFINFYI